MLRTDNTVICSLPCSHNRLERPLLLNSYISLEAIAFRLEVIAIRMDAVATRLEAIAIRMEAIATRTT